MRIVVIDDNVTNLIVLKRLSASIQSSEVIPFSSSTEALAYLDLNAAHAIVVDFEMPDMNGIEFIAAVRAKGPNSATPIIMVTGSNDAVIQRAAMSAGATAFLTKPISPVEFKARLWNLALVDARARA